MCSSSCYLVLFYLTFLSFIYLSYALSFTYLCYVVRGGGGDGGGGGLYEHMMRI